MRLRFDAFTWVVLAAVVLLVIAAVITVNFTDGRAAGATQYMTGDSPEAPVFNAIVAVQQGDIARARAEFTAAALAEHAKRGYDPIANAVTYYGADTGSRRIRIVKVSDSSDAAAAAAVVAAPTAAPLPADGSATPAATPAPTRAPEDVAYVTIAEDNFSGGGLFGPNTYSSQRVIRVAREDGRWKVDDPNLFY